jgi:hypothetical protein
MPKLRLPGLTCVISVTLFVTLEATSLVREQQGMGQS